MNLFINPNDTKEFYLSFDKDKGTRFTLKPLSTFQIFDLRERVSEAEGTARSFLSIVLLVQYGVSDIVGEGITPEFAELATPYGTEKTLSRDFVLRLHPRALAEISAEVMQLNTLSEDEKTGF